MATRAEQIAARDARIADAVARGESHASVAAREGVNRKTVTRALQRRARGPRKAREPVRLDVPAVMDIDPLAEVAQALAVQRHAEQELLAVAAGTANDSARVGALKSSVQVATARLDLLERIGFLPSVDREWWTQETEWAAAWGALAEAAAEVGVSAEELRQLYVKARQRRGAPSPDMRITGVGPEPSAGMAVAA